MTLRVGVTDWKEKDPVAFLELMHDFEVLKESATRNETRGRRLRIPLSFLVSLCLPPTRTPLMMRLFVLFVFLFAEAHRQYSLSQHSRIHNRLLPSGQRGTSSERTTGGSSFTSYTSGHRYSCSYS